MATATKVGAMIRRGAANVSPETRILVDNPDKVKAIVDEIDGRSDEFQKLQQPTAGSADELERAEAAPSDREASLTSQRPR